MFFYILEFDVEECHFELVLDLDENVHLLLKYINIFIFECFIFFMEWLWTFFYMKSVWRI